MCDIVQVWFCFQGICVHLWAQRGEEKGGRRGRWDEVRWRAPLLLALVVVFSSTKQPFTIKCAHLAPLLAPLLLVYSVSEPTTCMYAAVQQQSECMYVYIGNSSIVHVCVWAWYAGPTSVSSTWRKHSCTYICIRVGQPGKVKSCTQHRKRPWLGLGRICLLRSNLDAQ